MPTESDFMKVANLQDTFLNASLAFDLMIKQQIQHGDDPDLWFATPRARLERIWITHLYVLVESWNPTICERRAELVASMTSLFKLEALLEDGHTEGHLAKMRETRDYMSP